MKKSAWLFLLVLALVLALSTALAEGLVVEPETRAEILSNAASTPDDPLDRIGRGKYNDVVSVILPIP